MYSPNLWILHMFCLSSHFPKPWKDRTFPNRLQKQEIFPALSGSLETQVHKLHDGICRKIKRTQVIQGFLLWSHVHVKRIPNAAYLDKKFWRSFCKGLMIDWLPVGHKNAHILKSQVLDSLDVHHQQLGSWTIGGLEPSSWETTETVSPNALKPPGHLSRHRFFVALRYVA